MILFCLFSFWLLIIQGDECPFTQAFIQSGCLGNCVYQCPILWSDYETGGAEQDPISQCMDCPQPSPSCAVNAKCYPGAEGYTDSCNTAKYYDTACSATNPSECQYLNSLPISTHSDCADGSCVCSTFTKNGQGYCKLNSTNEELCSHTAYCGEFIPNLVDGGESNCAANHSIGANCTAYCGVEYHQNSSMYSCDPMLGKWVPITSELDCSLSCEDHICFNDGNHTLVDNVCRCKCHYGFTGPNCEIDFKNEIKVATAGAKGTDWSTLGAAIGVFTFIVLILWYGGALDCYSIWGAIKEIDFEDTTDSEEEVRKFEKAFRDKPEEDIFGNPITPTKKQVKTKPERRNLQLGDPSVHFIAANKRNPDAPQEIVPRNVAHTALTGKNPRDSAHGDFPKTTNAQTGQSPRASVQSPRASVRGGLPKSPSLRISRDERHNHGSPSGRSPSHRSPRNRRKPSTPLSKYSRVPAKRSDSENEQTFESLDTSISSVNKVPQTDLIRQYRIWE